MICTNCCIAADLQAEHKDCVGPQSCPCQHKRSQFNGQGTGESADEASESSG